MGGDSDGRRGVEREGRKRNMRVGLGAEGRLMGECIWSKTKITWYVYFGRSSNSKNPSLVMLYSAPSVCLRVCVCMCVCVCLRVCVCVCVYSW